MSDAHISSTRFPQMSSQPLWTYELANLSTRMYDSRNESTEMAQDNFMVIPLAGFIVWGFLGNLLVCLSILLERRLQNMTNCFLFSLAVADLMVSTLVMPLSFMAELHYGRWLYSPALCKMYVSLDVFLCSVSIAHMSVISLDRYWGISRPFATRHKTKNVVALKITCVWFCTILLASPITILATVDSSMVLRGYDCRIFSPHFIVYGSLIMFFVPFIVMAFTYSATVRLLKKKAALCAQELSPSSIMSAHAIRRSQTSAERKRSSNLQRSLSSTEPRSSRSSLAALMEMHVRNRSIVTTPITPQTPLKQALKEKLSTAKQYIRHRKHETFAVVANEQKATKVLGLVFATFFICWVPFFTMNLITGICGDECALMLPEALGSALLWLGYISSTINPIIYTTFNKVFRSTFKRILTLQICHQTLPVVVTHTINTQNYSDCNSARTRRSCGASQRVTYRFSKISEASKPTSDSNSREDGERNGCVLKQSKTFLEVPTPSYTQRPARHSLPIERTIYFV